MMHCISYNYPEHKYRADPCEVPSLSQSIAKILVHRSERHARDAHPRLGGKTFWMTHAMDVGTICHALMLGKPLPEVELIPFDDYKTKLARERRDEAIASGKIPLKNKEFGEQGSLVEAAGHIRAKLANMGVAFDPEHCEVAMFWSKNGAQCKARVDNVKGARVIDLKFTACAHPDFIDRQVRDLGYDIQHAAYTEAVRELVAVDNCDSADEFALYFCETVEPYCVTRAVMSPESAMIGKLKWAYAQTRWAECLQSGKWDEYLPPGSTHVVQAKPWDIERAVARFGGEPLPKGESFL